MREVLAPSDAIARFVRPGATIALEGFTHLIPFAAGHEIIRQVVGDLTLIRMTPDLLYDQMIGAGCARRLVFSWGGNPGVGSLPRLRTPSSTAGRIRSRSRNTATPRWRTLTPPRGRHAVCDLPRLYGIGSADGQPEHPLGDLPVHGRTTTLADGLVR